MSAKYIVVHSVYGALHVVQFDTHEEAYAFASDSLRDATVLLSVECDCSAQRIKTGVEWVES